MNLTTTISVLLAGLSSTAGVALTADYLWQAHEAAVASAARIQAQQDAQLLEAAVVMYQAQFGTSATPSVEQLVEAGYLKPEFLTRERVQVQTH